MLIHGIGKKRKISEIGVGPNHIKLPSIRIDKKDESSILKDSLKMYLQSPPIP